MGNQMTLHPTLHLLARSITLALAGLLATAASAQEAPTTATPVAGLLLSSDSDGFDSLRVRAGALLTNENPWRYAGVAVQTTRYRQASFSEDVRGALWLYRDQRRADLAGLDLEAGLVRVAGKTRPVGDVTWRMVPQAGTAIDLMASADLVDTPVALERGIGAVLGAVGAEHQLGERLTITGMAGLQSFSDGNARKHLRARLIWLALPAHGVTLQLRLKGFDSRKADVGGAYFNPDHYTQSLGVAAMRRRSGHWQLSAALGAGRERSTGNASTGSYLAEARAERTVFGDGRLVLNGGYYRAAGVVNSPNYAYRQLGVNLVLPLR
jgi:hypothetical protein